MVVDKKDFFRGVTLRICSSLDLEVAMWRCMQFLRDFIPGDEMYLHLYDKGLEAMHTIAGATVFEGRKMDSITPFPKAARPRVDNDMPSIFTINRPESEPGFEFMLGYYDRPDTSALIRLIEIDGEKLGALVLLAKGRDRFSEEHSRLFSLLNEPFSLALSNTLKHQEILRLKNLLADDNRYLHRELHRLAGEEIVGADFGLKHVMSLVRQVSSLNSPVLLMGETGVGKDVIANAIHFSSPRKDKPFIKVNCGAIPETLLDSELFGHEKGAFTGALGRKRGRFERAGQGTIFLDEIGELHPQAQVKLLRVLQYKEIERVGGTKTIPVDIRVIAATNRNLQEMVDHKQFRNDLWFRLNVFPIHIPPLRERKEDIPALIHSLLKRKAKELGIPETPSIENGSIDRLAAYDWPGNVRELENVIERALILNKGAPINFSDLTGYKTEESPTLPGVPRKHPPTLEAVMSRHIKSVLDLTGGVVHGKEGAAEILGINPSTLRNRMNKLGIVYGRRMARK
jgi:formate hydrogenlyase transcriptional activator